MKQNKSTSKLSAAVFSAISLLAFGCASSDKGVNTAEIIKYNESRASFAGQQRQACKRAWRRFFV